LFIHVPQIPLEEFEDTKGIFRIRL